MDGELLDRIDLAAGRVAESRAAYIRGACRLRLDTETAKRLDDRYVEGYRGRPEPRTWGTMGAKLLAQRIARERW
jgi:hypothetical protein